jgi:hypothetical protein
MGCHAIARINAGPDGAAKACCSRVFSAMRSFLVARQNHNCRSFDAQDDNLSGRPGASAEAAVGHALGIDE